MSRRYPDYVPDTRDSYDDNATQTSTEVSYSGPVVSKGGPQFTGGHVELKAHTMTFGFAPQQESPPAPERDPRRLNQHYTVSKNPSTRFTGRRDILDGLARRILPQLKDSSPKINQNRVIVIYGLAGSGKTQVVLKFAWEFSERFWAVFWIDASTKDTADQSVLDIATALDGKVPDPNSLRESSFLRNTVNATMNVLANALKPWLLIIDNADDPQVGLPQYIPRGGPGHIIITTRDSTYNGVRSYADSADSWKLGNLSESDAVDLLLQCLGAREKGLHERPAVQIARLLDGFPLAISQVSGAIGEGAYTMDSILERVKMVKPGTPSQIPGTGTKDYPYTTDTVWEGSRNYLRDLSKNTSDKDKADEATIALNLLSFLSFLHFSGIPTEFFQRAWRYCQNSEDYKILRQYLYEGRYGNNSFGKFENSTTLLSSLSLIQLDKGIISMHPLVHQWAMGRIAKDERKEISGLVTDFIFVATPTREGVKEADIRRRMLPHIEALRGVSEHRFLFNIVNRQYGSTFVHILFENGKAKEGIKIMEGQIDLYKKAERKAAKTSSAVLDPMRKFTCMAYLASCYSQLGTPEAAIQALELSEEALEGYIKYETLSSPRTIFRMGQVAGCLGDVGRYEEALDKYRQAKTELSRLEGFGEQHPETIRLMAKIALMHEHLGNKGKASEIEWRVFETIKGINTTGRRVPTIWMEVMEKLVNHYSRLGGQHNRERALQVMTTILKMQSAELGLNHPETLASAQRLEKNHAQNNLAPLKPVLRRPSSLRAGPENGAVSEGDRDGGGERRRSRGLSEHSASPSPHRRSKSSPTDIRHMERIHSDPGIGNNNRQSLMRLKAYSLRILGFRSQPDLLHPSSPYRRSISDDHRESSSDDYSDSSLSDNQAPVVGFAAVATHIPVDRVQTGRRSGVKDTRTEHSPDSPRRKHEGLRHPVEMLKEYREVRHEAKKRRKQTYNDDLLFGMESEVESQDSKRYNNTKKQAPDKDHEAENTREVSGSKNVMIGPPQRKNSRETEEGFWLVQQSSGLGEDPLAFAASDHGTGLGLFKSLASSMWKYGSKKG